MKKIYSEKYILNKNNGTGNFPPFYDILYDNEYSYLVEGHMGLDLKSLFTLSDKNFDLPTIMKNGIYILGNLKFYTILGMFILT